MSDISSINGDKPAPAYRSGVAARMAGLPVETLRVWERRYGLSDTSRSDSGQRLYSAAQVRRLGLLKQLVDQGHPIGQLAGLPGDELEQLIGSLGAGQRPVSSRMRVAVVGQSLVRRIAADRREQGSLDVQRGCDDLTQAVALFEGAHVDALLVELSELDHVAVPLIVAARAALGVSAVVVMYRFCASATIRELRAHGCLVARVPAELGELLHLCRTAMAGKPPLPAAPARAHVAPRRFNDEVLASITNASNTLQCECPRHLAELLMMTGSFERYSAQCANRNEADAQLHQELEHAAGLARTVLEAAMARLARAEGIRLAEIGQ